LKSIWDDPFGSNNSREGQVGAPVTSKGFLNCFIKRDINNSSAPIAYKLSEQPMIANYIRDVTYSKHNANNGIVTDTHADIPTYR
jgi:hypothetical protein